MEIRELTALAVVVRLLVAMLLGGIIGAERGLKNRAAGLRTYLLVCIGSCIIMMTNQYVYQVYRVGDPVRMSAQVISGIGFLGAGTIIVTKRSQIKGLTTAAGLWASASIGLAVGIGLYEVAVAGGIMVFFILTVLNHWDFRMRRRMHTAECYMELRKDVTFSKFIEVLECKNIDAYDVEFQEGGNNEDSGLCFIATLKGNDKKMRRDVMLADMRASQIFTCIEDI